MKTTMNISVEANLKEAFTNFAREIWTNPTNLINMLMQNSVNNREVLFTRKRPNLDIEIESFSKEELEELKDSKSIIDSTKRIKKALSNKINIW